MDKNNLKNNKKSLGIIIALAAAIIIGVIVLVIAIVSVISSSGDNKKKEDTSQYTFADVTEPSTKSSNDDFENMLSSSSEVVADAPADNQTQGSAGNKGDGVQAGDVVVTTTAKSTDAAYNPVEEYEKLSKNGDNILSDYHGNKFIKLVSEKYDVDTKLLVAIYSDPDTGNNFVLQFNGKTNSDGEIIKSPDTLEKIYLIDKKKNISVATGKTKGNEGVSYAEGTLCFYMIKTVVMPQYPDYFTGV